MPYLDVRCPKCKQTVPVPPGRDYKVCDRCATPHCIMETGQCGVEGCNGWVEEKKNDTD